jgi:hypothetical protein
MAMMWCPTIARGKCEHAPLGPEQIVGLSPIAPILLIRNPERFANDA